jgi:hypothetical protein
MSMPMSSSKPLTRRTAWREAWIGLGLVMVSTAFGLGAAELAVRAFSSDAKRWEWNNNFRTDQGGRWSMMQFDPQLGYVPRPGYSGLDHVRKVHVSFDKHGLRSHRHNEPQPANIAPPILVVGNSYAMGEEVHDDETFPSHLEEILDHRVLNGGVKGYGIDQVVLRAEELVQRFRPGILVMSFIADDVRRSKMRILWGMNKPYFEIVDGGLVLRNVPVPPPPDAMRPIDSVRALLGYSFLVNVSMRRLGLDDYWLRGFTEEAHDNAEQVSCLLMDRLRQRGREHRADVLLVAQYSPHAWHREATLRFESDIIDKVLACANASELRTLDTRQAFEAAVRGGGVERYYVSGGHHLSDAGNRLTAELIANRLQSGTSLKPDGALPAEN